VDAVADGGVDPAGFVAAVLETSDESEEGRGGCEGVDEYAMEDGPAEELGTATGGGGCIGA